MSKARGLFVERRKIVSIRAKEREKRTMRRRKKKTNRERGREKENNKFGRSKRI
jgi:hypothetical protein